jgi:hypothetical protein
LLDRVDRIDTIARRSLLLAGAGALGALVGFCAGCSNLKMPVPPELVAVSEEVPITGRSKLAGLPGVDESFRIGPYEIADVDRDPQFSVGGSVPLFSHRDVVGGYSYLFRGSQDERRAVCAFEADKKVYGHGAPVSVRKAKGTLRCVCRGSESESDLTVRLSYTEEFGSQESKWVLGDGTTAGKESVGELRAGGRDFLIRVISSTATKGKTWVVGEGVKDDTVQMPSPEPTGCLVYGDGLEAGLELLHPGRAWFARSLNATEREDIACLFGGLLLYKSPSEGPRR